MRYLRAISVWGYCYVATVCALWVLVVTRQESDALTLLAYALAAPHSMMLTYPLILFFALLQFDPTSSAPLWQNIITGTTVVACMTLGAALNAFVVEHVVRSARSRLCRASRGPDAVPFQ